MWRMCLIGCWWMRPWLSLASEIRILTIFHSYRPQPYWRGKGSKCALAHNGFIETTISPASNLWMQKESNPEHKPAHYQKAFLNISRSAYSGLTALNINLDLSAGLGPPSEIQKFQSKYVLLRWTIQEAHICDGILSDMKNHYIL